MREKSTKTKDGGRVDSWYDRETGLWITQHYEDDGISERPAEFAARGNDDWVRRNHADMVAEVNAEHAETDRTRGGI